MVIKLQLWASVPYADLRRLYLSKWLAVDDEKHNDVSLFFSCVKPVHPHLLLCAHYCYGSIVNEFRMKCLWWLGDGAPAEPDCAVEWGAGEVTSVDVHTKYKRGRTGRTVTPRWLLLLHTWHQVSSCGHSSTRLVSMTFYIKQTLIGKAVASVSWGHQTVS